MGVLRPIATYLNDFLEYCEIEKGLSPNTSKNYARFLRSFFGWLAANKLSGITPADFTADQVWKYRVWLSRRPNNTKKTARGLSGSSQTRYLVALRVFLSYLHEKDIPTLPLEKVKLPKERERQVKFLVLEQIEKLLNTANGIFPRGLRDRAILEVLFSTGLRVAELVALDRKQFYGIENKKDFELSVIGKGGHPRTVYFSERALRWIKEYLKTRKDKETSLYVRTSGPKNAPARLSIRSVERLVQYYAKKAGIPLLATPHTLRHSFATDLLNQGVDLRLVQEFLGHRNIGTTQIYTHVTRKQLRDIHRKYHGKHDEQS